MQVLSFPRSMPAESLGTGARTASSQKGASGLKKPSAAARAVSASSSSWLPATPPLPLTDGDSLGVVYLEWLVCYTTGGSATAAAVHDEYAKLLMEKIPAVK
jgi:hypothetical protein